MTPHTPRGGDQAQGLRTLFRGPALSHIGLVANPYLDNNAVGVVLERITAGLGLLGRRTLVIDASDTSPRAPEGVAIDLGMCIESLSPDIWYLPARGLPKRFVDTRGNSLQLTPPRPLKVSAPDEELKRLFYQLVDGKVGNNSEPTKPHAFPTLQTLFTRLSSEGRARLDYETSLPVLGQHFTVPYAYQNGVLNLVQPHLFERNSARASLDLAIRGDLIKKHGVNDHQESRLIVISKFSPKCEPDFVRHVDQLFSEYSVKHVHSGDVEKFADQVEAEAHAA